MAWRLHFLAGDLLACMAAGVAGGWLALAVIPGGWLAPFAMVAGMIMGMIAGLAIATLLTPLFGSFEVLMPSSLAGMVAAMVFAMIPAMVGAAIGWMEIVWGGALVGLLCLLVTYLLQARLCGEVH